MPAHADRMRPAGTHPENLGTDIYRTKHTQNIYIYTVTDTRKPTHRNLNSSPSAERDGSVAEQQCFESGAAAVSLNEAGCPRQPQLQLLPAARC
eukprot:scaffold7544_cov107-Isochrysis_galbana.AAC.3